jgi:hypothetical protein
MPVNSLNSGKAIIAIVTTLFVLPSTALAQNRTDVVPNKDRIDFAQRFMRAIYSDLNGKGYILGVQTYLKYDKPEAPVTWLQLDIGEGPKDKVLYYVGGCANVVITAPPSVPPSIKLRPSQREPTEPTVTSTLDGPPNPNPEDCRPGPVHPRQLLSAMFWFDVNGGLSSYGTVSPGVRELEEMNHFASLVLSHPEMSDAEVLAALKNAGAKYGPNDQDQFVKHVPIAALEPFLGKLQVLSVGYAPLFENRNNVAEWPKWTIRVKATRDDGADAIYELSFEQFRGELRSLHLIQPEPNKP